MSLQFIQNCPDAILLTDESGFITTMNPAALSLLGDVCGKRAHLVIQGYFAYRADGARIRVLPSWSKDGVIIRPLDANVTEEKLYLQVARNLPGTAVLVFDHDLRFIAVEGEALASAGYSQEALQGKTLREAVPEPGYSILLPHYLDALRGYESEFELDATDSTGNTFYVKVVPLHDENNPSIVIAGMVVTSDITRHKKRLWESESRYQSLTENNHVGIWQVSRVGQTLYANPAMLEMLGVEHEVWIDERRYIDFFAEADHGIILDAFARHECLEPSAYEAQLISTDGTKRTVLISGAPLAGQDGEFLSSIKTIIDITERKIAEEKAQENENLLNIVINNMPVMLWVFDMDGVYTLCAGKGLENLQRDPKLLLGQSIFDLSFDNPAVLDDMRRALSGESFHVVRNSQGRVYESYYHPAVNSRGGQVGTICVSMDITERQEAEEQRRVLIANLEHRTQELERSNADLEQFAYIASHDLQEPLRMVASYTQLLGKRYHNQLDDDANTYIEFAVEGANRLQTLIQDLLSFSRIGRDNTLQPVDLNAILQLILHDLSITLQKRAVQVTTDDLPTIMGDSSQMQQLFLNLISNAIKFCDKETPTIHIGANPAPDEDPPGFIVYVQDNGIGIEEQYHERIFRIFKRLNTRAVFSGNGLGLAICKKIVDRHSGRIWVESEVGVGSIFHIYLPKQYIL